MHLPWRIGLATWLRLHGFIASSRTGEDISDLVMKTLKSLVLAGISSLLLTAGFARAAEKFDPLSVKTAGVVSRDHLGIRAPCSIPCFEN